MSQELKSTFVEEAREHVDTMEGELTMMLADGVTADGIAAVFRAAHSIKGSANAFSLKELARVTHALETWLDGVRGGRVLLGTDELRTLLRVVDELSGAVEAFAKDQASELHHALELVATLPHSSPERGAASGTALAATRRYAIELAFDADALFCGVEPLALLLALDDLGEVETRVDAESLPALAELEPLRTYLAFQVRLNTAAPIEQVRELLDWGDAIKRLEITEEQPVVALASPAVPTPTKQGSEVESRVRASRQRGTDGSVRVSTRKLDELMTLLGELVITQSRVGDFARRLPAALQDEMTPLLRELDTAVRELQGATLRVRMVPVSSLTMRLPRLVADVSHQLQKRVRLEITGGRTEVDKLVVEALVDPMQHLLRNAIGHGIESPEERSATGKPEFGVVAVRARQRDGFVEVEVADDGRGIHAEAVLSKARRLGLVGEEEELSRQQILDLLFAPGLSTADVVTDVSGRGVGMDVVRQNIEALGGTVTVASIEGRGTTFTVRLPLTTAIIDAQIVRSGGSTFVLPLLSVREVLRFEPSSARVLRSGMRLLRYRDVDLPLVDLAVALEQATDCAQPHAIIVAESERGLVGLGVDGVLEQRQVVVKSLSTNYGSVEGINAATVLGDGTVALIVDVAGVAHSIERRGSRAA